MLIRLDSHTVEGKPHTLGEQEVGLGVEAYFVAHVGEKRLSGGYHTNNTQCLTKVLVRWMRLVPQCVDDERIDASERRYGFGRNFGGIGDIG